MSEYKKIGTEGHNIQAYAGVRACHPKQWPGEASRRVYSPHVREAACKRGVGRCVEEERTTSVRMKIARGPRSTIITLIALSLVEICMTKIKAWGKVSSNFPCTDFEGCCNGVEGQQNYAGSVHVAEGHVRFDHGLGAHGIPPWCSGTFVQVAARLKMTFTV